MSANTLTPVSAVSGKLEYKSLVDDELWVRLTNRIAKDEGMELSLAERIMDQALAFLALSAKVPEGGYSPSPLVDIGWHTFILYTKPYADFCERIGSQFIHHNPCDEWTPEQGWGNIRRTVDALTVHGYSIDQELWKGERADCDTSYCGGPCGGE